LSEALSVEGILHQAERLEKEYDWLAAAGSYEKALKLLPENDLSRMGEIHERLGYAFYRAAFQSESNEEFRRRLNQAVQSYEKSKDQYQKLDESKKKGVSIRCEAMIAYVGYWLAFDVHDKKGLIDECWRLTRECLKAFEENGDAWEYGRTFNQLSMSSLFGFFLSWDVQSRERMLREAIELGERAVIFLSTFKDPSELAGAYAKTVVLGEAFANYFQGLDEKEGSLEKFLNYWQKAKELSEEIAIVELLYPVFGPHVSFGLEGTDEALANYGKALEHARKTRDKFFIGCALDWLVYHTRWKTNATENPEERERLNKAAQQYAEDARHQFSQISFISPRTDYAWIEAPQVEYYYESASFETNPSKKRDLLEKAVEAASHLMKRAEDSRYPEALFYANHVFGLVLPRLAMIETNSDKKKELLEKALEHRREALRFTEQFTPFVLWNRGIELSSLARTKARLAELFDDSETKKKLFQEAVMDLENALGYAAKELAYYERKGSALSLFPTIARDQFVHGNLLIRLYEFTCNKEYLRKAVGAFEDTAESYKKPGNVSRVAEAYWKSGQVYDTLSQHLKSAESFNNASDYYDRAAQNIPKLRDFYQDHARYMQAWSEIEKARHHHARQEYGLAEEHFEKAATMHKSLKQWSYMAPNYSAWTQVERAEELSRKEQSEEAALAFQQAARLFEETKRSLQTELGDIEILDEKRVADNMIRATDLRYEYCVGRIALEEAKIFDKKGDHYSSSEKYDSASRMFEEITKALESEQDKKELKLITTLSQAWAKMTQAEAEESPKLYVEASQLFEQAKEFSPNERTRMLASGHSRFCRALEKGIEFADTKDQVLHDAFLQHLESASNYYVKAGFRNASEYAKATKLLFDAYLYMDNAQKETDPETKAKLYMMADKVLQTSAGSFMVAEHPEKREQVLRLLEKVKEERELALSLSDLLHAPAIVSTTTAFSTPTPNQENAVGLERFENADIQVNAIVYKKELKVGEDFELEIELINAGKGSALLIKLMEVIPEGFELKEKPETYRVEDGCLNMKGKRLQSMKTEELKIVLRSKIQGVFRLRPRILYLDENGRYRTHEPEPVSITIKELGIKGWLKG
jgi:hypothetical protein